MKTIAVILFPLLFYAAPCNTNKRDARKVITGKVIKIADGDTFTLLLERDNFEVRVRLNAIDCPEKKQPFSKKAKQHLSDMIFGKRLKVYYKKKDRYGRVLGDVFIDHINVNKKMVCDGYAWHFKKYSDDPELAKCEENARKQHLGLWQDAHPTPPWEWRKRKRK